MKNLVLSVSALCRYVDGRLRDDPFVDQVWIEGEAGCVSTRSQNCYFQLSDEHSSLRCVVFGVTESKFRECIFEGAQLRVRGTASVWSRNSFFNLLVRDAKPVGQGEQYLRLMALHKKLESAGFFSPQRKRPLPAIPRHIAIITSRDGAALHDILQISERRNPAVRRTLYPVAVQGQHAAAAIIRALDAASRNSDVDLVILARGGGSAQDLSAFSDEEVVHAIARSAHPVVSAVGHETDWSLADLAADVRASTPSAAAEIAVPESAALALEIRRIREAMLNRVRQLYAVADADMRNQSALLRSRGIAQRLVSVSRDVSDAVGSMRSAMHFRLNALQVELKEQTSKLSILNPSSILASGYAIVLKDGRRVYKAADIQNGDELELMFSDGTIVAHVPND